MKKLLLVLLCLNLYANGLTYLNQLRQQTGEIALKENKYLSYAAQNHSNYMNINHIASHYEKKGNPGFTGIFPYQRALFAGYSSKTVTENFSYGQENIKKSIDGLFSAIYHRFGFLDPSINEIGLGQKDKFYTYDMGNSYINELCIANQDMIGYGKYYTDICKNRTLKIKKAMYDSNINLVKKSNPPIILWPAPNTKNIPPAFFEEEPDPLPDYSVSGYPISIIFNSFYFKDNIQLISFKIFKHNQEIKKTRLIDKNSDVNHKLTKYQFALFPLDRLDFDTTYYITCKYQYKNKIYNLSWNFHTEKLNNKKFTIINKTTTISIQQNKKYIFYFKPTNSNDRIHSYNMTFYQNQKIDSKILDYNTLSIKVKGQGKVTIYLSNNKKLILKVN